MLFRPDRSYRDAVLPLLRRLADPETADAVIAECARQARGRGARGRGDALLARHSRAPSGASRRSPSRARARPRRSCAGCCSTHPSARPLEPVLWQLAASGRLEERLAYLARLAVQPDAKSLPRWHRLARDPEKALREKALVVLAQHDPGGSVDLFVEQLPLVDYSHPAACWSRR